MEGYILQNNIITVKRFMEVDLLHYKLIEITHNS